MILATQIEPLVIAILILLGLAFFWAVIFYIFRFFHSKPIKRLYPDKKPPLGLDE